MTDPDPLATPTDLAALLKVDPYAGEELTQVTSLLDRASSEIRSTIGQHVTRVENETITLPAYGREQMLDLPQQPVVSVSAVQIDGVTVTDYKPVGGQLFRRRGWLSTFGTFCDDPSVVTVTYTHGIVGVPEELNTLCCALAAAAKAQIDEGGGTLGPLPGVSTESIDDYRVGFVTGPDAPPHVMTIPEEAAERLRSRYGTGVTLVGMG